MHDDCISVEDRKIVADFVLSSPKLTYGERVKEFEAKWSEWLGVKHSVFVNSGSSANLLVVQACKDLYGDKHGWVAQACTWATNVSPIIQLGQQVNLVDVSLNTLGPAKDSLKDVLLREKPKFMFMTHVLGLPGFDEEILDLLRNEGVMLLEDTCESHGSTFRGKKLGSFGKASTFSFYYGHHITTIEGGMICTDDTELYHHLLLLRSHGLLRELPSQLQKDRVVSGVDTRFTFLCNGFNVRNTDVHAVLGINQMRRLDLCTEVRNRNYKAFLNALDPELYHTDLITDGVSNFALPIISKRDNIRDISRLLETSGVENRPLIAGNLFRHPMMNSVNCLRRDATANWLHDHALYVGNNEFVTQDQAIWLAETLNRSE
jgi:CDP-6-deoxy-D-xylo-4-hexulose-3-dehydrase